ncbi:TPA: KH domain-containing protein [Candidatus Saccharibacteria bacterium]|nr:KH domain-containing protein [Candidatus Saccharibacteria bacterium]HIO87842.1 KH domain-containing protein [Candidatus Saccharibacteria bacterium]
MNEAEAFAKKYLEDFLTFFDLNVEVTVTSEGHVLNLSVPSSDMNGYLIGERGTNLRSIQHLVNTAIMNKDFGQEVRATVDVAEYKKQRNDRLAEQAKQWAEAVLKTGTDMDLNTMSAADRRIVHKTLGEIEGVHTESVGEGRDRHIVIRKD